MSKKCFGELGDITSKSQLNPRLLSVNGGSLLPKGSKFSIVCLKRFPKPNTTGQTESEQYVALAVERPDGSVVPVACNQFAGVYFEHENGVNVRKSIETIMNKENLDIYDFTEKYKGKSFVVSDQKEFEAIPFNGNAESPLRRGHIMVYEAAKAAKA
jgi:hypothetical protein